MRGRECASTSGNADALEEFKTREFTPEPHKDEPEKVQNGLLCSLALPRATFFLKKQMSLTFTLQAQNSHSSRRMCQQCLVRICSVSAKRGIVCSPFPPSFPLYCTVPASILGHRLFLLEVLYSRLDGVLGQHGTVQLHRRKTQMLCDVRVLDGENFVDVLTLHPLSRHRTAGDC